MTRAMATISPLRFSSDKPPLGLIAGPTASGKSAYALALARSEQAHGRRAVLINADSAQMYADLRVLSARPDDEATREVPHRLYGLWDGGHRGSAAEWAVLAEREIADVQAGGGVPILVGGTGLYLRALLDGLAPIPVIDPQVRTEVRALTQDAAREALLREDPVSAARLAPADAARTQRALEVVRSTGRSIDLWRQARCGGIAGAVSLDARLLLPPREQLYLRCDARVVAMMREGAVEEVQALLERNLPPDVPVMRAIGVREVSAALMGELSFADAMLRMQIATRQYAKRQYTWFHRQTPPEWARYHNLF